jgi:hypothetical protein|nr:MAG TPA: hypothetical protein [Caudoviricetes sp.]
MIRLEGAGADLEHHLHKQERLERYRERLKADSDMLFELFELFEPLTQHCSVIRTSLPTSALGEQRMIFIF